MKLILGIAAILSTLLSPKPLSTGTAPTTEPTTTTTTVPTTVPVTTTTDPISSLPEAAQSHFKCIEWTESRYKLVDTNPETDAQGMFQFLPYIWQYARNYISGLPPTPNQANRYQQDSVAVFYYQRNNGFYPEWSYPCE